MPTVKLSPLALKFACFFAVLLATVAQAQHSNLTEIRLDPAMTKADARDARKALQAGTAIVRIDGGSRADVRRLLEVTVPDVTVSSRSSSVAPVAGAGQQPRVVIGTRSKLQGFAIYKDGAGTFRSAEIYAPPSAAQDQFNRGLNQWVTREQERAAGQLADDPSPPAQAWTKLYADTVINQDAIGNSEETAVSIYRLNSIDPTRDYYMVYSVPTVTPSWDGQCDHIFNCGWHTINREFWTGAISGGSLNDHGPTSTVGTSSAGFSIGGSVGPTGPGVSAGFSASWSQPDVVTSDLSNSTTGHWFENWNSNNYYAYCNPLAGSGPPTSAINTFLSRHAAIFVVPGGTASVTLPMQDTANFCDYRSSNNGGFGGADYSTANTSWQVTLSPPTLSTSTQNLTVPPGGTEPLLVDAYIPGSSQGLVWTITSNHATSWLTVPSAGPFSVAQAIPVSVAPGTPDGSVGTLSVDTVPPFAAPSVAQGPIQVTVTVGQPKIVERAGVLLAGGANDAGLAESSFYDYKTKQLVPIGQMQTKRFGHTATRLPDGDVLLIGGTTALSVDNEPAPVTGTAEIFHPSTLSFTSVGSLAAPRSDHVATLLPDGKVLVTAGEDGSGNPVLSAELWDPATGNFSAAGKLSTSAFERSAVLASSPGQPTRVLVFGGVALNGQAVLATELWDEASNYFSAGSQMQETQGFFPIPVKNAAGQFEIVGGYPQSIFPSTKAEQLLAPGSLSFTSGSGLMYARSGHTLTALQGTGDLLVTGGGLKHPATAEIRKAGETNWTALSGSATCPGSSGCMTMSRAAHTATPLPDGTVLIAGGEGSTGQSLGATEIYTPSTGQFTPGAVLPPQYSHTATFISQSVTTLLLNPSTAEFGQSISLVADVHTGDGTPTGTVMFYDGATLLGTAEVKGTTATFSTSRLGVGTHSLTAAYAGDDISASSVSAIEQVQITADSTTVVLSSSVNPSNIGRPVSFTASVNSKSAAPTGSITFKDGDAVLGILPLSGGKAVYSTSSLSSGTHAITAAYSGDAEHAASTSSSVQQVVSEQTTSTALIVTPASASFGGTVRMTATITGTKPVTGAVVFLDGSTQLGSVQVNNSRASFSTSSLVPGSHSLRASYGGDATHASSVSSVTALKVGQAQPGISLTSSVNPSTLGQPVIFRAILSGPEGATAPTGTVIFSDGTNQLGQPQTVFNGTANLTLANLAIGTQTIYASYNGDANYTSAASTGLTQVVLGTPTTTSLTSTPRPAVYGQTVSFRIAVSATTGKPTGMVTLSDGSTALGTVSLTNASAVFNTSSLSPGTHSISARYAGDSSHASSSAVITQVVRKAPTTTTLSATPASASAGQIITLRAVVTGGDPKGVVELSDGSTVIASGSLVNGAFSAAVSTLAAGPHRLTAKYQGDAHNRSSTSAPVPVTVTQPLTPSVSLTSSANPSDVGQGITFVANVSGPGVTPTGTVALFDASTQIGAPQLLVSGRAAFTITSLSQGTHQIGLRYSGDAIYAKGSATLSQIVHATIPVVVSLRSTPNPSFDGQAVTFTALVKGVDGSAVTGSVTISEGQVIYGAGTLVNGRAVIQTTQLLVGLHEIRATYGGDATHQPKTSGPVQQQVNRAATVVSGSLAPLSHGLE